MRTIQLNVLCGEEEGAALAVHCGGCVILANTMRKTRIRIPVTIGSCVAASLIASALVASQSAAQTAESATTTAIAQIKAIDPQIHAVIAIDPTALDQARTIDQRSGSHGRLYGYAILLKDNIEADGPLPTTAGSMALLDNVTHRDAPLVKRLRAADAVILGKTNLSEWANIRSSSSISGWSAVGGQTRNPYALDRDPCGSSSGSAAAVAGGEVKAAIGTETDGSITCPAAVNGVVGLKPTVGLVSRTRIVPISHSQDTAGPIAVDVATAARVLGAIAGSDPDDAATKDADTHISDYSVALKPDALKGARIGVLRFATGWSAETDKVFERALAVLKAQGAILVEITDLKGREKIGDAETLVLNTELKADLNAYLASTPSAVKSRTLSRISLHSIAPMLIANSHSLDRKLSSRPKRQKGWTMQTIKLRAKRHYGSQVVTGSTRCSRRTTLMRWSARRWRQHGKSMRQTAIRSPVAGLVVWRQLPVIRTSPYPWGP